MASDVLFKPDAIEMMTNVNKIKAEINFLRTYIIEGDYGINYKNLTVGFVGIFAQDKQRRKQSDLDL
jgi:hypothetical protein